MKLRFARISIGKDDKTCTPELLGSQIQRDRRLVSGMVPSMKTEWLLSVLLFLELSINYRLVTLFIQGTKAGTLV